MKSFHFPVVLFSFIYMSVSWAQIDFGYDFVDAIVDLNKYKPDEAKLESLERPLTYFIDYLRGPDFWDDFLCEKKGRYFEYECNNAVFLAAIIDKIVSDRLAKPSYVDSIKKITDDFWCTGIRDIIRILSDTTDTISRHDRQNLVKRLLRNLAEDEALIFDFKPHYLNRLAYELDFRILRVYFDDSDFWSDKIRDGGYIYDIFRSEDGTVVVRSDNFFLFDMADIDNISYSVKPIDGVSQKAYKSSRYSKRDEMQLEELKKIEFPRTNDLSKYLYISSSNLLFVSTDAGLHLYSTKTKKEIDVWLNFFTGNDIE